MTFIPMSLEDDRKIVGAVGPLNCKIAFIGEALGADEEREGIPFIGQAGRLLNQKLHRIGLARQEVYITNLVKYRPAGNDFSIFWEGSAKSLRPTAELCSWRDKLLMELQDVKANIFVLLGANALWALTGRKEITNWRGSVVEATLPNGRVIKVMATFHPSYINRVYKMNAIFEMDLIKALRHSAFPELCRLERELIVRPSFSDVLDYANELKKAPAFSYDIETSQNSNIVCIGFADSAKRAMSIPTTKWYWRSFAQLKQVLQILDDVMQSNAIKITSNGMFDIQWLVRLFGILPAKPWDDTQIGQYVCYPDFASEQDITGAKKKKGVRTKTKALAFLASIYTEEPFWKDEVIDWKLVTDETSESLWKYNAKDCCLSYEVMQPIRESIKELKVDNVYQDTIDLSEVLIYMMLKGVRLNEAARQEHIKLLQADIAKRQAEFEAKHGKINLRSPKQVLALIRKLGLRVPTKKGKPTTSADAIEKLADKSPEFKIVSDIRSDNVLLSNHLSAPEDMLTQRWHCSYNCTATTTGRLSSSEGIFGSATNLQNLTEKLRNIIIPDENRIFINFDLKGAEAVVVAYLSEDPALMHIFETGKNVHNFTGNLIWGVSEEIIKEEKERLGKEGRTNETMYYKAKRVRHSGHYKASWKSLKDQLKIEAREAKILLDKFYAASPNILKWHDEVIREITDTRTLITPFGRVRRFYDRISDDLIRAAIAYVPQSTVADLLNKILVRFYATICKDTPTDILLQVHDSGLIETLPELAARVCASLVEISKIPITIKDRTFTIPIEIKVGCNWRDMVEIKEGEL